jgi:hypothetical protein
MSDGSGSSRRSSRGESVVEDWGRFKGPCGYCQSPGCTSISHGLSFFLFNHYLIYYFFLLRLSKFFVLINLRSCWLIALLLVKYCERCFIIWILDKLLVHFNAKKCMPVRSDRTLLILLNLWVATRIRRILGGFAHWKRVELCQGS